MNRIIVYCSREVYQKLSLAKLSYLRFFNMSKQNLIGLHVDDELFQGSKDPFLQKEYVNLTHANFPRDFSVY